MFKTNAPYFAAAAAALLFLSLLIFGRTRPTATIAAEKMRSMQSDAISSDDLLASAKQSLGNKANVADSLEKKIQATTDIPKKIALLKRLSGEWCQLGSFALGGVYAEQLAKIVPSDTAWSMAGTTFMLALQQSEDENLRNFASNHATTAFESAISLNPTRLEHKINLALSYVEKPGEMPMKGIGMLTKIAEENPTNTSIFLTLGRLSLRTGQYEKAKGRFETVLTLDKANADAHCLLAKAYEGLNDLENAKKEGRWCK